jgi:ADP-heptose:LPS heptosyltransferase
MDRSVGIPVIAMLGLLRRRSAATDPIAFGPKPAPQVITLLKSAAIGDTVLLSAVVRDIRAAMPGCRLRLACGSSNAQLAKMVDGIDDVIVLPMSKPILLWRMRHRLRSDVFIDFDSWPRINALITYISNSSTTIGFRTPGQHRHALYDVAVDHSTSMHEVENYRRLVHRLVASDAAQPSGPARPWLRIPEASPNQHENPAKTVVFHMYAGGSQARFKEWPEHCWTELAKDLIERGLRVVLSGGPADLERNLAFVRRSSLSAGLSVLPITELPQLASFLGRVAIVVSVDTGIAHLAGASGAQTVVLHGATSPDRWGALGPHVRHLKDAQTPWIQLGFEVCQDGGPVRLTVGEVRDAVIAVANQGSLATAST